jgi:hypothetical protein
LRGGRHGCLLSVGPRQGSTGAENE